MQTTNGYNQSTPFSKGMLVNRIFANNINGDTSGAPEVHEALKLAAAADKYAGVKTNAIEDHLKDLASLKVTENKEKPFFGIKP